jgi:diguanylate cyclase (GGDEF)-like protein
MKTQALGQKLVADAGRIAWAWAENLLEGPLPSFKLRSSEQLRTSGVAYATEIARFFLHHREGELREAVRKEALWQFRVGLPLGELVASYWVLLNLIWTDIAVRENQGEPALATYAELIEPFPIIIDATLGEYERFLSDRVMVFKREIEGLRRQIQDLTIADPLTGLMTLPYLETRLAAEVRRAERHGHRLCLLVVDVDRFSRFTDANGTLRGDQALHEIAQALTGAIRESDIACRTGIDEFVVIMPETKTAGALAGAERIRAAVEDNSRIKDDTVILGPFTVSVGVAEVPGDAQSAVELLARARAACAHAKRVFARNAVATFAQTVR